MTVFEYEGPVVVELFLDTEPTEAGEFWVRVTGGTATQGNDFQPHVDHFTVEPGQNQLSVPIAHVINDGADEGNETITFELVIVSGLLAGFPSTLTVTIEDDDDPGSGQSYSAGVVLPDALVPGQETVGDGDYRLGLTAGELQIGHTLPAYNGRIPPLALGYSSTAADPRPIFIERYQLDPNQPVPGMVSAQLTFNGSTGQEFFYDTSTLAPGDFLQMALQADATSLATGRYAFQIDVTAHYETPITDIYAGQVSIINPNSGFLGDGWSLAGLERLHPVAGGVILQLDGGLSLWFADGQEPDTFITPVGDFSTLVRNPDGTYTRTLKNGVLIHFDDLGCQTAIVERNGNTTAFTYSASCRLLSITDPFGLQTSFTYSGNLVTAITDPAGRVTQLAYNGQRLISITDPDPDGGGPLDSPVTAFAYDAANRIISWTNPRQFTTSVAYDFAGRVNTVTRPDGSQEQLRPVQLAGLVAPGSGPQENPAAPVLADQASANYTDPRNQVWTTLIDNQGFGLPTQSVDPLGNATNIQRDFNGLPTEIMDPIGRTTFLAYDNAGNPIMVTFSDGADYLYAYNSFGQVTQLTEPDPDDVGPRPASVTRYVYDAAGNLTDLILPDDDADPDNNPRQVYAYNGQGLVTGATDPGGFTTNYAYDARGQLTQVTYADDDQDPQNNPTVALGYDTAGNLTSRTDERGYTTSFAFDNLARLTELTSPDDDGDPNNNPRQTFAYDAGGNLIGRTDPLGNTTSFTFSTGGQLTSVTDPDPDGAGPLPPAVTSYQYDAAGNMTGVTDPIGRQTAYTFDGAGRMTQLLQGTSYVIDYEYDGAGQLLTLSGPAPDYANYPSTRLATSYSYTPRGWISSISDTIGRLQTYDFNLAGEQVGFS